MSGQFSTLIISTELYIHFLMDPVLANTVFPLQHSSNYTAVYIYTHSHNSEKHIIFTYLHSRADSIDPCGIPSV